jgi:uncharacterized protein YcbK (DUF882 family)
VLVKVKKLGIIMRILLLLLILTLPGCMGGAQDFWPGLTAPEEGFIHLSHAQSGEEIRVQYAQNGHFDRAAFTAINRLMRDQRTGEIAPIHPYLIDFLAELRRRLALPQDTLITVTSGYRSKESNDLLRQVNGQAAKESKHTEGRAADIRIGSLSCSAIAEVAKTMQRGGVACYPKTKHIHIDVGDVRSWATW